jgi:hypothetical protein
MLQLRLQRQHPATHTCCTDRELADMNSLQASRVSCGATNTSAAATPGQEVAVAMSKLLRAAAAALALAGLLLLLALSSSSTSLRTIAMTAASTASPPS